jgi:hypothetical protein
MGPVAEARLTGVPLGELILDGTAALDAAMDYDALRRTGQDDDDSVAAI